MGDNVAQPGRRCVPLRRRVDVGLHRGVLGAKLRAVDWRAPGCLAPWPLQCRRHRAGRCDACVRATRRDRSPNRFALHAASHLVAPDGGNRLAPQRRSGNSCGLGGDAPPGGVHRDQLQVRPRREGRGFRRSRGDTSGRRCHDRRATRRARPHLANGGCCRIGPRSRGLRSTSPTPASAAIRTRRSRSTCPVLASVSASRCVSEGRRAEKDGRRTGRLSSGLRDAANGGPTLDSCSTRRAESGPSQRTVSCGRPQRTRWVVRPSPPESHRGREPACACGTRLRSRSSPPPASSRNNNPCSVQASISSPWTFTWSTEAGSLCATSARTTSS